MNKVMKLVATVCVIGVTAVSVNVTALAAPTMPEMSNHAEIAVAAAVEKVTGEVSDEMVRRELLRTERQRSREFEAQVKEEARLAEIEEQKKKQEEFEARCQSIVDTACQYVGNPYVYGGDSLTNGIDCSHFIWHVLQESIGYDTGYHVSYDWYNYGEVVESLDEALAGDVLVWDGHVAFYMGDGQIVHASNSAPYPQGGIKVSDVNDAISYHGQPAIRRFVTE